ncbi:MAG: hypothetical protein ACK4UP_07810 [Spirosomataceae bacterium]
MTKNYFFKRVYMTCFFIFYIVICAEAGSHPKKIKGETQPNDKVKETVISPAFVPMQPNSADQFQLDNALANLQGKLTSQIPLLDHMENIELNVSDSVASNRGQASSMFSYLDQNPEKVKTFISFEDLVTLPIGLKQNLKDNTEVSLGIYSVEYTSSGARLTVFVRIKMKVNDSNTERVLLFGSDAVTFTRSGGLGAGGTFKVALLGDYPIPMKNWTLVLKGASEMGNINSSTTFASFNCDTFSGAGLGLDIVFPRDVLVPFHETERVATDNRVKLSAFASVTDGFNDIYAAITTPTTFASASLPKFGFKAENIVLDLSDFRGGNEVGLFPQEYENPDKGSSLWRGIFIGKFSVLLSKEFNNKDVSSITGTQLLIDRTGFSGTVSFNRSSQPLVCDAQKWPLTISSFSLSIVQNKFIRGGFGGSIRTPLNTDMNDANAALGYNAIMDATGEYLISINTANDSYPIKCWRAKAEIYKGSWINLTVKNNLFYPSANLNGELNIAANASTTTDGTPETEGTVAMNGIVFSDLMLKVDFNGKFQFSVGEFKYQNTTNSRLARFPISITRFEKINGTSENDLWIGIGFRVGLAGDRFAGATDLVIRTNYNKGLGKFVAGSSDGKRLIQINRLYVKGSIQLMDVEGYVNFFENTSEMGLCSNLLTGNIPESKGFCGKLDMVIKKPFKVGVELNALFGYNKLANFSYGFFSAYVGDTDASLKGVSQNADGTDKTVTDANKRISKPGGGFVIPTGIADLGINGLGIGVYFNMKPKLNATHVVYEINNQIPFGFKLMLGIQNNSLVGATAYIKPTFKGRVNVDFALDRQYGINSIALSGVGTFASELSGGNSKVSMADGLGKSIKNAGVSNDALMNTAPSDHTPAALISKSKSDSTTTKVSSSGDIVVAMGVLLDIPKKVFHAEAEVYMNFKNPVDSSTTMRGIGVNDLAGRAIIHFEKSNTYVHIGRQEVVNRVGIRYKNNFEFGAYLMMGKGIGPLPLPPIEVLSFFPTIKTHLNAVNSSSEMNGVRSGNGFAVGAHIKANINAKGLLYSIKGFGVGGMDLLLIENACPSGGLSGKMQLYGVAQIQASLGKRNNLFNGTVGFYLNGNGFRPFNATGNICITYGKKDKKLCPSITVGETGCI